MTGADRQAWLEAALERTERGEICVLVTVAQTRGSTPRETGAKMLVWSDGIAGTVGGGHLEFKAIATARAMLADAEAPAAQVGRFSLGPELAQCCGGGVALLFERLSGRAASWLRTWTEMESAGTECVVVTEIGGAADAKIFADPTTAPRASGSTQGTSTESPLPLGVRGLARQRDETSPGNAKTPHVESDPWALAAKGSSAPAGARPLTTLSLSPKGRGDPAETLCVAAIVERAKGAGRCALIESRDGNYVVETIRPAFDELYLFGAGHVGKAVVRALQGLPFRITWIDARARVFPEELPPQVRAVQSAVPVNEVDEAPAGALFLVMTHSHPLDLEICARVLQRNDAAYLGLIGSETKRARFAGRLRAIGIAPQALARLTCPIGIPGIAGKQPAVIAASVAAQLLIVAQRRQAAAAPAAARALGMGS